MSYDEINPSLNNQSTSFLSPIYYATYRFSHNMIQGVLPRLISNYILDFSQMGMGFGEILGGFGCSIGSDLH